MTVPTERLRHLAMLVGFDLAPILNEAADEIDLLRDRLKYMENKYGKIDWDATQNRDVSG